MNLSLESISALLRAADAERQGLEHCIVHLVDKELDEDGQPDPMGPRWRGELAAIRVAIDELTAMRDHLRRISR